MRAFLASLLVVMTVLVGYFTIGEPMRIEHSVNKASDSVVFISIVRNEQHGSCSGIVLAPNRILTARHCVEGQLWADGKPATVLSKDDYFDLALLSAETSRPPIARSHREVRRGDHVVGIGYAFGWSQLVALHDLVTLTNIIPFPTAAPGIIMQGAFIGGMSGGPIVDANGRLVSIVQQGTAGVSHGVPVSIIEVFLLTTDTR